MFKVVKIGKYPVKMKASGITGRLYQRYFGRDILSDFVKIANDQSDNLSEVFEELTWTMAKSADNSIPDIEEWLEQFEMMDIVNASPKIMELMGATFKTTVNSKKK